MYFPENPYRVDKEFFWRVWLAAEDEKAERYIKMVFDARSIPKPKIPSHKYITIDDSFLDKLLEHPVKPGKFSHFAVPSGNCNRKCQF